MGAQLIKRVEARRRNEFLDGLICQSHVKLTLPGFLILASLPFPPKKQNVKTTTMKNPLLKEVFRNPKSVLSPPFPFTLNQ